MLFDGDSITAGATPATYGRGYVRQAYNALLRRATFHNTAVPGQTMATTYANRAGPLGHHSSAYAKTVCHLFAATNDIETVVSGNIANYNSSGVGIGTYTWTNSTLPYIQAAQGAGFGKVLVGTCLPRVWSGSGTDQSQKEAERVTHNGLIASNAATYGYTVIDYASVMTTSDLSDGTHPSETTCPKMDAVLLPVLGPLIV